MKNKAEHTLPAKSFMIWAIKKKNTNEKTGKKIFLTRLPGAVIEVVKDLDNRCCFFFLVVFIYRQGLFKGLDTLLKNVQFQLSFIGCNSQIHSLPGPIKLNEKKEENFPDIQWKQNRVNAVLSKILYKYFEWCERTILLLDKA